MTDPIVSIDTGQVRGFWRDGSAAFLGIGFAEPPVGGLRFAAPQPRAAWEGIKPATEYGATPQRRPFGEVTTIPEPSIPGDDILNVNVFTPAPDTDARLPVLVWIHGGGFKAGSPASPWYDGAAFNRDGVVTVTLSYRLGFEGFGYVPDAPDNRGLLDQIEALRWVQRNIAAFGGDPAKVTIAGQSAGGGSVLALMISPMATGLFAAAICESGSLNVPEAAAAQDRTAKLCELAGVEVSRAAIDALDAEQVLDLSALLEAAAQTRPADMDEAVTQIVGTGGIPLRGFAPYRDGRVLTGGVAEQFAGGAGSSVPLLIGCVANEFSMAAGMYKELPGDPAEALGRSIGPFAAEYVDAYAHLPMGKVSAVGQLVSDLMFRIPLLSFADAHIGATWSYDLRYAPPGIGMTGHCAEVPLVWDNLTAPQVAASLGDPPPQELADVMHGVWVRFVTNHDAQWPQWDSAQTTMIFDTESHVGPGYLLERSLNDQMAKIQ